MQIPQGRAPFLRPAFPVITCCTYAATKASFHPQNNLNSEFMLYSHLWNCSVLITAKSQKTLKVRRSNASVHSLLWHYSRIVTTWVPKIMVLPLSGILHCISDMVLRQLLCLAPAVWPWQYRDSIPINRHRKWTGMWRAQAEICALNMSWTVSTETCPVIVMTRLCNTLHESSFWLCMQVENCLKGMLLLSVILPWKKNKQIAPTCLMLKRSSSIYFGKCYNGSFWLQFSLAADGRNKKG